MVGNPLPADGVIAREIANSEVPRAPMASTPAVQAIVDRIDPERWFQTMSLLAAFNRNSFSATLGPARDWILSAFEGAQLASSVFPYTLQNVTSCTPTPAPITIDNPIGTKLGTSLAEEWIVVGAHYDSRNSLRCDGVLNPQPGANDNASGCAGVIELARVFAHVPTERSILFMCFSGEEQGLVGSRRYVESLTASGDIARVKHMINLDMIGFDPGGTLDARVDTNAANAALLAQYAAAAATYAPELNVIGSSNTSANTDHWYFLQAGVPAVFTWENGASIYPHYHQSTDTPANMTRARELAGGILKMDAAMLATVAGLVPPLFADGFE
jgi:Zn-dependent M28 family amino/carboxypeptidase